ncbi:MAG: DUF2058 family protein [Wenzhouxiangella sp.]
MGALQDALLKAGVADETQLKPRRRDHPGAAGSGKPDAGKRPKPARKKKQQHRSSRPDKSSRPASDESDLAKAYKARQRAEVQEKEEKKKQRQAAQEERRKRNLELDNLVKGNTLNRKDAEIPRYFEHMGRIRRVLCTPEQRAQLNQGEIGVVNLRGTYILVSPETLEAYRSLAPDLVPDLAPKEPEDDGSHYPPVPDDLIW